MVQTLVGPVLAAFLSVSSYELFIYLFRGPCSLGSYTLSAFSSMFPKFCGEGFVDRDTPLRTVNNPKVIL